MYFKYGSYQHPDNEVTLAQFQLSNKRNPRGFRTSSVFTIHITGEILGSGQSDLTTKIDALIAAYSDDFKDAGFYQDDDTPTPHLLVSNHPNNLTGNVITYRSWPSGDLAEYATKRTFAIGIEAEFRNAYSQFVFYEDNMEMVGDGGSAIRWVAQSNGLPILHQDSSSTPQMWIHSGTAVALDAYPLPPPPMFDRPNYLGHLTRIRRKGPRRYAQGFQEYTTEWYYVYQFQTPNFLLPTAR